MEKRTFVHLAYLDDSDTRAKKPKWQVMSGVIIEDKQFNLTEIGMHGIAGTLAALIPADKLDDFQEFHACELYGGYGVFEKVEQENRFEAIGKLLSLIKMAGMSVVYGAVDLSRLEREVYASADPLDISFRICAKGIQSWMTNTLIQDFAGQDISRAESDEYLTRRWLEELVILIADDCDKRVRDGLQKSFRSLRPPMTRHVKGTLFHFHDDMYFGDSRYSLGIQLADLCSYFIARHLAGDTETDGFYNLLSPQIVFSESYPAPLSSANNLAALAETEEAINGK